MKKFLGWFLSFLFIALAVAIIFRVGFVKRLVTGEQPAAPTA